MLLYLSLTGIVLSIILLYFNFNKFKSAIYLGAFFFLVSFYSLIQHVMLNSKSVLLVSIFFLNFTFLIYLIGPFLYWYVRSVLTDDPRWKKKDLWHLLPSLFFLTITFSYIIGPYSNKYEIAIRLVEDISNLKAISVSNIYDFFPGPWLYLSRPLLVLAYICWSTVMIFRYARNRKTSPVISSQKYMIKWLSVLLGFMFIMVVTLLILMTEVYLSGEFKLLSALGFLTVISGTGLVGLLISPFFFPGILYGLPRFPVQVQAVQQDQYGILSSPAKRKIKDHALESDYIALIENKLDRCMRDQQLYLIHECNMVNAAKCMGVPVHHLAYYFREEKKQSFNDYRNELRLNHAKKLIREGKAKDMTLEGIGLLSGFSTRKTFIASFKKMEGVPPGVFVSRLDG